MAMAETNQHDQLPTGRAITGTELMRDVAVQVGEVINQSGATNITSDLATSGQQRLSLDSRPVIPVVVLLLCEIVFKWNDIGVDLAVPHGVRMSILQRPELSNKGRLAHVIQYWLNNSDDPTWRKLLNVIELENKRVATNIRHFLGLTELGSNTPPQLPASPSRSLQVSARDVVLHGNLRCELCTNVTFANPSSSTENVTAPKVFNVFDSDSTQLPDDATTGDEMSYLTVAHQCSASLNSSEFVCGLSLQKYAFLSSQFRHNLIADSRFTMNSQHLWDFVDCSGQVNSIVVFD